jgi:sugar phosphate isomerase/epimerase
MAAPNNLKFGTELVTFFHPQFWNVTTSEQIVQAASADPKKFWDRILDSIQESGVTGLEICFPPFDWKGAIAAYGSPAGFAVALHSRGLELASGFSVELNRIEFLQDKSAMRPLLDKATAYSRFLRECGGDSLVVSLPLRSNRNAGPASFVDLDLMRRVADFLHQVGTIALDQGIELAVHTEAHSLLCTARDVDLLMALTDPYYVSLCPDTGHLILAGADPIKVVERHLERVAISHWKDAIGPLPRDFLIDATVYDRNVPYFRRVGAGIVDWTRWMNLLRVAHFKGWAILEVDTVPDPVAEIKAGREFIEKSLLSIYA